MESRTLGVAGLPVTRMGLGLAALGRPAYINLGHADDLGRDYDVKTMRQRTARVLDAAWSAGMLYVDVARSYGRAEDFLASWLRSRPPHERPVVGSKWAARASRQVPPEHRLRVPLHFVGVRVDAPATGVLIPPVTTCACTRCTRSRMTARCSTTTR